MCYRGVAQCEERAVWDRQAGSSILPTPTAVEIWVRVPLHQRKPMYRLRVGRRHVYNVGVKAEQRGVVSRLQC